PGGCGSGRADRRRWRHYSADRERTVDHRMETGHWDLAAALRRAMGSGVRTLQADPGVSKRHRPRGHDAERLQVHLLLGVVSPPDWPGHRLGLRPAASVVLGERRDPQRL